MTLPPNAKKRFPKLTVVEAATLGKEKGLAAISPGTINSYLNNLSALFKWAVNTWRMERNPDTGLQVADAKKDKGKKPFDLEQLRSEEHTSELQSLMRISYDVCCLKQKQLLIITN